MGVEEITKLLRLKGFAKLDQDPVHEPAPAPPLRARWMRSARELAETALQLLRETVWARITARTIEVFRRGKAPLIAAFEVSMGGGARR